MSFPTAPDLKAIAVDFLHKAASGSSSEAFAQHVAPTFRHHNPHFRSDAISLRDAMQQNTVQNPGKTLEILHALQEGELVAVHSRVRHAPQGPEIAVVHLFKFHQNLIVELWDIAQPQPDPMLNEHGMF